MIGTCCYLTWTLTQRADAFRNFARSDRVDGLLIMSLRPSHAEVESLQREGLAAVLLDASHPALARVVIDDLLGGEIATERLLGKGHTRIGFVGDAPSPFGFTSSELRRRGMGRAMRRAGIKPQSVLYQRGPHGRDEARESAERLPRLPKPPTATFAACDMQAMGVLEAAREHGLRVPQDLALIGFDDIEVAAVLDLTAVRQPLRETGYRGAELPISTIDGVASRPVEELASLELVERRTT